MTRRLLNLMTALSLLLCVAVVALGVRSYWVNDRLLFPRPSGLGVAILSERGEITVLAFGDHDSVTKTTSVATAVPPIVLSHFVLLIPAAVIPFFWAICHTRWWRKRKGRMSAGHCPFCGYDLRATPGGCPECGGGRRGGTYIGGRAPHRRGGCLGSSALALASPSSALSDCRSGTDERRDRGDGPR